MKLYERLWVTICTPLTMVGLSLDLVFLSAVPTAPAIVMGAVATILAWVWLWQGETAKAPQRTRARVIARCAVRASAATGAVVGFAVLLGVGAVLLLIVVLASSPSAVSIYGRWLLSLPTLSPAQLDKMVGSLGYANPDYVTFQPSSGAQAFTDAELCQSWRDSHTVFSHQASPAQMAATAAERQTCLDELERRNPNGFAAWLALGAWASGNPLPYLTPGWADQPAINWDELTRGQGC